MPRPRDLTDPKVAHLFLRSSIAGARRRPLGKSGRRRPNERKVCRSTDGQRSRRQGGSDRRTARARRPVAAAAPWIAWDRYRGALLSAASLAIAFSIWQVLSTFIFNPFLIPPPIEVIRTAIPMVMSGEILAT